MKLPVPSSAVALPSPIRWERARVRVEGHCSFSAHSAFSAVKKERARVRVMGHRSSSAVALVITLILLSVITFMAVTFLVVSRAQKGAVSTTTDQTTAKLAADAGFERAKAELLAPILAFTNPAGYDLRVSTNYVNPAGFIISGVAYTSFTNASYNYPNGQSLTGKDALQNLANLLYDPRPPVFVTKIG